MVQMSAKRDYYEVLGIARQASPKEVADAYRKLAIKYPSGQESGRRRGDRPVQGSRRGVRGASRRRQARPLRSLRPCRRRGRRRGQQFTDINDIFESFGDIFGDGVFGDLFGGGRQGGRRRARKGADVGCEVHLDLLEAAKGVTREVEFERHEKCTECDGTGARPGSRPQTCSYCGGRGQVVQATGIFRVQTTCPACHGAGQVIKDPCAKCRGAGFVARRVKRDVIIPAGVDHQMRIRLDRRRGAEPRRRPGGRLLLHHPGRRASAVSSRRTGSDRAAADQLQPGGAGSDGGSADARRARAAGSAARHAIGRRVSAAWQRHARPAPPRQRRFAGAKCMSKCRRR